MQCEHEGSSNNNKKAKSFGSFASISDIHLLLVSIQRFSLCLHFLSLFLSSSFWHVCVCVFDSIWISRFCFVFVVELDFIFCSVANCYIEMMFSNKWTAIVNEKGGKKTHKYRLRYLFEKIKFQINSNNKKAPYSNLWLFHSWLSIITFFDYYFSMGWIFDMSGKFLDRILYLYFSYPKSNNIFHLFFIFFWCIYFAFPYVISKISEQRDTFI